MSKPNKQPIDFAALRRAIMVGSAEAARDAGLEHFVIAVTIDPAVVATTAGTEATHAIQVEIVELSDEQAATLRGAEAN